MKNIIINRTELSALANELYAAKICAYDSAKIYCEAGGQTFNAIKPSLIDSVNEAKEIIMLSHKTLN